MNKILAAILSISLLVSSVSPSLAQIVLNGRVAEEAASAVLGKKAAQKTNNRLLSKGAAGTAAREAATKAARNAAKQKNLSQTARNVAVRGQNQSRVSRAVALSSQQNTTLRDVINRSVQEKLLQNGNTIRALVKGGQVDKIASRILSYPKASFRQGLLRNEFVTVALKGGATGDQIAKAVEFYRADLKKGSASFSKLSQNDLNALLRDATNKKSPAYQTLLSCHQALASAGALGLLGSKADAAALLDFYKAAAGSAFGQTAAVIAARGMLRQGAYKELEELAALTHAQGPFWQDLAALAAEKGLPVQIAAVPGAEVSVPATMSGFLKSGCVANELNANFSRQATEQWLALGTTREAAPVLKKEAAAPVKAAPAPALDLDLPEIALSGIDLNVAPIAVAEQTTQTAAAAAQPAAQAPTKLQQGLSNLEAAQTAAKAGILYSGIPVDAVGGMFQKAVGWVRSKLGRKAPAAAPEEKAAVVEEEPGLHDDTEIHEVFSNLRSPEFPAAADEVISANETSLIPVSEKGLKLTLIDEQGVERILPVNLEISNRFRVKGYNRIAFAAHSDYKLGYVAELRNQSQKPLVMSHFYMRLQANQVGALADLIQAAGVEKFSLKLESNPDVAYKAVQVPAFDFVTGKELPLEIELPRKSLPKGAKVVVMENGALGILKEGAAEPYALNGYYVRLPKNQIGNFVKVLRKSPTQFNVSVHPTQNRADLIMRDASLTNVSLGKTMGPVVNGALNISVSAANSLMFIINYMLPGFASVLTPMLKKYGEKKMMVLSLVMSSAAGILASAGGFYGFVDGMTLGPVSKGLFITALFLMSGSSILKQLVSNMLIRANRGEVILDEATDALKKAETQMTEPEKQGFKQLAQRMKEFFTKKSSVSLKDVVLYNLSFVYKNIGTLAFLASPYLINKGIMLATGTDLGLDYSISFPIYAVYSGYVAWKVWRARLRDAYTAKNLEQSRKNLELTLTSGAKAVAGVKGKITSTQIDDVARAFKDALDARVFSDIKINPKQRKSDLYNQEKETLLKSFGSQLVNVHGMPADKAADIVAQVRSSLSVQENTLGNMAKMLKAPGVAALTTAMTLATVHEFVISSSFASTMKTLIDQGEFANFLIACSLYVPLIAGRLGGNLISRRISADSMYIFCSALSAIGTGIMATAGGSISQMITGAAIASFGVGNYFTQMYDYIMNLYPKQNRELSSILALTMAIGGLGAIPAGYVASMAGMDSISLLYAGVALGASLLLTPGMMVNSTFVKALKYEAGRLWKGVKNLFKRNKNKPGNLNQNNPGSLDDAAPVQ